MLQLISQLFVFITQMIPSSYCTGSDNQFFLPFFLNMLRCRELSAASMVRIQTVGHFYSAENMHAHYFHHVVEVAIFPNEKERRSEVP